MTIRILIDTIDEPTIQKILEYYNQYKDEGENPLQKLDRAEGGFQIDIPKEQWKINRRFGSADENDKIRQMRWKNGILTSPYIGFTGKQGNLLYDALCYALPGKIILE
jgi:hypothetical protein